MWGQDRDLNSQIFSNQPTHSFLVCLNFHTEWLQYIVLPEISCTVLAVHRVLGTTSLGRCTANHYMSQNPIPLTYAKIEKKEIVWTDRYIYVWYIHKHTHTYVWKWHRETKYKETRTRSPAPALSSCLHHVDRGCTSLEIWRLPHMLTYRYCGVGNTTQIHLPPCWLELTRPQDHQDILPWDRTRTKDPCPFWPPARTRTRPHGLDSVPEHSTYNQQRIYSIVIL